MHDRNLRIGQRFQFRENLHPSDFIISQSEDEIAYWLLTVCFSSGTRARLVAACRVPADPEVRVVNGVRVRVRKKD